MTIKTVLLTLTVALAGCAIANAAMGEWFPFVTSSLFAFSTFLQWVTRK